MAGDPHDESSDRPTSPSPDDSTTPMDAAHLKGQGRRNPAALGVGELLANRYKVLRFIGEGGMGAVYEAEDCELRERVALKTILPEIARQEESIQRFKREIQLARKVTHPNVCRIFDLVYHGTTIFLTMELLEGETLSQRLRRTGAMTTGEAFPLVSQMVAGLATAHQAGIVHRDFKCNNVMLVRTQGEDGGVRAVIMDFGLARRYEAGDGSMGLSTTTGAIAGTPAYMAPEQVEGRDITPAADIYALGVVMYEMVTGRCPFEGDTPLSVAVKRVQEPAPSPRSHNPSLDSRWEKAILRCLERNPKDRFASAEEIIRAIEPQAPPVEPSEQPRMLEAAAPKRAAVGRSMRLLAMIRRVESAGLKPFVDIEETAPLTQEDIRAKPFRLEFPLDRKGAPQSAEIVLRLDSPDFHPKSQSKKLMVPPERDSELCTFLLTPKVGGELLLNLEVLKGEVLVASRAIRTVAEITKQQLAIGPNVLVSIPLEVIAYSLRAAMGAPLSEETWPPEEQAGAPSPPPAPSALAEKAPVRGAPVSEAAKSMPLAEELRRLEPPRPLESAPPTKPPAPALTPTIPIAQAPAQVMQVTEAPKAEPAAEAHDATLRLRSPLRALAQAEQKAMETPPPPPLPQPQVQAPPPTLAPPRVEPKKPAPAPAPPPIAPAETAPLQGAPLNEAAKPMQYAEELPRSFETPRTAEPAPPAELPAPELTPTVPMAQAPVQATQVSEAPQAEPASGAHGAMQSLKGQAEAEQKAMEAPAPPPPPPPLPPPQIQAPPPTPAPPPLQPKKPAPVPAPPRVMPAPPVMARKGGPKKSPMLMVAGIAGVVMLSVGGYIFFHRPSPERTAAPSAEVAPVEGEKIQQQERQEKILIDRAKADEDAQKWGEAFALYTKVVDMNGPMKDQALQHIQQMRENKSKELAGIEKDTFQQATRALQNKEYTQARDLFQQVITMKIPDSPLASQAQTQLEKIEPILRDKAEFDAAAGTQNRGDLQGALRKFQAIAEKPGTYQLEAKARIPKIEEMINNAGAQQEFNAALQTENSGNRQGALEQFKAIAGKGGPFKGDAQTHIQQINDQLSAAAAGQQFDEAARVQNSGDLSSALALFKALAGNPGPRQSDAQQRVQSITDQITQQQAQLQFNAAVQAQNNGDLKAALAQFKALASKPSPLQPLAQAKADLVAQLLKPSPPPNPVPSNPVPATPTPTTPAATATRNPVVTPLSSGALMPLTLPYHKGMTVADVNVDGGLKATNLAMPSVQGAPPGSLVLIMIRIDENGSVSPQRVINDTSGFGPQVQEAARAWKFNPPTAKGKPVNTTLTVKVTF